MAVVTASVALSTAWTLLASGPGEFMFQPRGGEMEFAFAASAPSVGGQYHTASGKEKYNLPSGVKMYGRLLNGTNGVSVIVTPGQ